MMTQIKIDNNFFANAMRDYSDPVFAWAREIFQNCADAPRSSKIDFILKTEDYGCSIEVRNNGRPMSEDQLVNKLLALGGSQKEAGNVGGFGKAKELLYFAQRGYVIHSGTCMVNGAGGSYELDNSAERHSGTMSYVETNFDAIKMSDAITKVVALSNWHGTVTLDHDGYKSEIAARVRKGYRRQQWDWADIYTNKSGSNRLLVRIGGIPMFSQWCAYSEGTVVVELKGASKDTLTANRDGLIWNFKSDLETLIQKISVDKRSAFRWARWEKSLYGSGMLSVVPAKAPQMMNHVMDDVVAVFHDNDQFDNSDDQPEETFQVKDERRGHDPESVEASRETTISFGFSQVQVDHQFVIKNGVHDTFGKQRAIPAKFLPCEKFSPYSKRLTKIWVQLLTTLYRLDERNGTFRVGFIFDDETNAEYEVEDGITTYYINPANFTMKWNGRADAPSWTNRWKTSAQSHELISLAAHEYAHQRGFGHDEEYASELTRVMGLVCKHIADFRACFK